MKRPYTPRAVAVEADPHGRPLAVAGLAVSQLREEWLVEDGWWTQAPLKRRYFELVLSDGRDVVVYRDGDDGGWYLQRA